MIGRPTIGRWPVIAVCSARSASGSSRLYVMMSLAWSHWPAMFGCPSGVRGGVQFGSSSGGCLGSIQFGGGGFFGGGGACDDCAATDSAATETIADSTAANPSRRPVPDRAVTTPPSNTAGPLPRRQRRMELVVKGVAVVLEQLQVLVLPPIEHHAHLPGSCKH